MDSWHSYPSIYNLGHKALAELFCDPVLIEEKVDGSQFSFGVFADAEGKLYTRCRSKGAELNLIAPEKMFNKAIETVNSIRDKLHVGWTYRAEYLLKPKHNTLCYDRIPIGNLIIFDVNTGNENYLSYEEKKQAASWIGLETVPIIHQGGVTDVNMFRELIDRESCLGGQKVEGVVVKNYNRFGPDKKALMGKFVSEAFKESHSREWKKENPSSSDVIEALIDDYRTQARWAKAIQHLRDSGQLEESSKDIGLIMKEVPNDIEKECLEEIKEKLWQWAWPKIARGCKAGVAEWYKDELLKKQFSLKGEL